MVQDQLSSNASYNWDAPEAFTNGNPIDKGMFVLTIVGSGGKSAVKVVFGHGARHLAGTALAQAEVEKAIVEHVQEMARVADLGVEWWGHVVVQGQVVQYRAYQVAEDVVNVGTYVIPAAGKSIRP